jgi:hypothetical protein
MSLRRLLTICQWPSRSYETASYESDDDIPSLADDRSKGG